MESKNVFSTGLIPTLTEVLETRENRAKLQENLVKKFQRPVLAFKLNIPGPVKNNDVIVKVFEKGKQEIKSIIQQHQWKLLYEKELNIKTGPEYFCVLDIDDAEILKIEMIKLEESSLGRIYDIDVLFEINNIISSIDRTKVGYPARKCFICDKEAKECGRNRTHSVEEMQQKLEELILKDGSVNI